MKQLFKALLKLGSSISINGTSYSGSSVVINGSHVVGNVVGGDLVIDGVRQPGAINLSEPISVSITGDVAHLDVAVGKVEVTGSCGSVKTMSGDVTCGAVSGDVGTMSGAVKCGEVSGKVKTMSGDITMKR